MARKPVLSPESLATLGLERLAVLVFDEQATNPAFRKRVNAALAGLKGPEAVAALIDRRLAALEKARAMISWEKERAFAEDLAATVATIAKELGAASPTMAVDRLLRFTDSHVTVFERIDDSSGRIQAVYANAIEAMAVLVERLDGPQRSALPERLMASLARDTHGLARRISGALIPLLDDIALGHWDRALASNAKMDIIHLRQTIADARGDLDGFLRLEAKLPDFRQDQVAAAERLLKAGRPDEALAWVRRKAKGRMAYASVVDLAEGRINRYGDLQKIDCEARILDALSRKKDAQALRWATFEATLNPDMLRSYIARLDDFAEFDALDKAFALVANSDFAYLALDFFIKWPRLDLAAKLVLDRATQWEGQHYEILAPIAGMLEDQHPDAATVIYRALLNAILDSSRSQAYLQAVLYLKSLEDLAPRTSTDAPFLSHEDFVDKLRAAHARKSGFWILLETD